MPKITVRYSSIDRFSETRHFKTLAGAQAYAQMRVGRHPEVGCGYAVCGDGVGKVTVSGASLSDLFPCEGAADAGDALPLSEQNRLLDVDALERMRLAEYDAEYRALAEQERKDEQAQRRAYLLANVSCGPSYEDQTYDDTFCRNPH